MPEFSATFTTLNAPYNIFDVISGQQTTGVTPRTGSKTQVAGISTARNWSRLQITVDGLVAGILYVATDKTVSATNLIGIPIPSGDNKEWAALGGHQAISLPSFWFIPDTNLMLIHFNFM